MFCDSFFFKSFKQIKVDEKGKIVDARFKTFGCGSAIASSSLATEWVKGKSVCPVISMDDEKAVKCFMFTCTLWSIFL